jgi:hypothetical protein
MEPTPAPKEVDAAPAPKVVEAAPAPAPFHPGKDLDFVHIYTDGQMAKVDVLLGSISSRMTIDTGANGMSLPAYLANRLVEAGDAYWDGEVDVSIADGSTVKQKLLIVRKVSVGSHTLENVGASVGPTAALLLPFPVLNLMGRFTIDTKAETLIFS